MDFWGNESHGCLAPNPVPRRFLPDRRPHAREIERLPRSRAPLRIAERERFLGKVLLDSFGLAIQKPLNRSTHERSCQRWPNTKLAKSRCEMAGTVQVQWSGRWRGGDTPGPYGVYRY